MIDDGQLENPGALDNHPGNLNICLARIEPARWVIMGQHHAFCAQRQGCENHFAWIERNLIDRTRPMGPPFNDLVAAIDVDDMEMLDRLEGDGRAQVPQKSGFAEQYVGTADVSIQNGLMKLPKLPDRVDDGCRCVSYREKGTLGINDVEDRGEARQEGSRCSFRIIDATLGKNS